MRRGSSRGRTQKQEKVILPQELTNLILLRLPVKSLVRFKIVCKSWLSHISDPNFAISQFDLAAARTERIALLVPFHREFRSIDINASLHDDSASSALDLDPLLSPKSYSLVILGSCRGFLLLICGHSLYVWNPSTGLHKTLVWSPIITSDCDFEFTTFLRGFGYDPSTDDYLVVLASYNRNLPQDERVSRFEYFSLRANAWKEIEGTNFTYKQCYYYNDNQIGCFFNSAVHWLAHCCDVSTNVIVAFDLTERSVLEIPLPIDFQFCNLELCVLRVLGELFSLCAVGLDRSVEIWVMEKYKVQSSWTKTIVVSVENVLPGRYFFPICTTASGDIVGKDLGTGLVRCNDKGQLQEHRSYFSGRYGYEVAVYTESLLSLPCDNEPSKAS